MDRAIAPSTVLSFTVYIHTVLSTNVVGVGCDYHSAAIMLFVDTLLIIVYNL